MIDALVRRLTTTGVRDATRLLCRELAVQWRHHTGVRQARRFTGRDLRLHVGCGPNYKPGWVNIDLSPQGDLRLDIREPLPFPAASAVIVYSEHVLEHLRYPGEMVAFLAEARRVLRPGGVFSAGVPDAALILRNYYDRDEAVFARVRALYHPGWCVTPLDSVNYFFRQDGEHQWAYDEETLLRVLTAAGFTGAARRPFDPALDSPARKEGTLYVQASAP
jgi:predicted SAM-dependent methyltransferase